MTSAIGAEGAAVRVHVNHPGSTRYVCRVRMRGCRRWKLLPGESKRLDQAAERLARMFVEGGYKRGEVLVTADYYEPATVFEMVKR